MKTQPVLSKRPSDSLRRSTGGSLVMLKRNEGGMVTVIFIILLAIMIILVMAESSSVIRLHREVRLLERQQIKRLNGQSPQPLPSPTNQISTATTP